MSVRHGKAGRQRVPAPAAGSCCASKTSTTPVAGRISRKRSSRNWPGSVSTGTDPFAANPSISPITARLDAAGLIYPCFCTRRDIQAEIARAGGAQHLGPLGELGLPYPGTCRRLDVAERAARREEAADYALRLDVATALERTGALAWHEDGREIAADPATLGDVVLARKEFPTSYHLAVTVDDAVQGVTLVTRGADLLAATHIHRLLQALLGLPTPRYRHHPLLTDAAGRRLAKRDGAVTVRAMREAGMTPAAVLAAAQSSGR
jgi:glutamyl-Q tRNA(Asp) synthetase